MGLGIWEPRTPSNEKIMISINLIPEDKQKRRRRGGILPVGFVLPREVIIGLIGGFIVLLLATHILFQAIILVKFVDLKSKQAYWNKILPEKTKVDDVMAQLRSRNLRIKTINDIRSSSGISWARKLNAISDAMLRGIWLRSIEKEGATILIEGSSVSKHKVEMITVHNFVKNLKENEMLMRGVSLVELDSIKTRKVGDTSVADFMVRIELEKKEEKSEADDKKKKR